MQRAAQDLAELSQRLRGSALGGPGEWVLARAPGRLDVMGGFADINPDKLTVLAEEAFSLAEVQMSEVDERIADTKEDILAAKSEQERARLVARLAALNALRAAL